MQKYELFCAIFSLRYCVSFKQAFFDVRLSVNIESKVSPSDFIAIISFYFCLKVSFFSCVASIFRACRCKPRKVQCPFTNSRRRVCVAKAEVCFLGWRKSNKKKVFFLPLQKCNTDKKPDTRKKVFPENVSRFDVMPFLKMTKLNFPTEFKTPKEWTLLILSLQFRPKFIFGFDICLVWLFLSISYIFLNLFDHGICFCSVID